MQKKATIPDNSRHSASEIWKPAILHRRFVVKYVRSIQAADGSRKSELDDSFLKQTLWQLGKWKGA
jgi:hypothetical protein